MIDRPGELAAQVDEAVLLSVLTDVKDGDFSARMPLQWTGRGRQDRRPAQRRHRREPGARVELEKVSRVVGKEGKLSQRVSLRGADRVWRRASSRSTA